MLVFFYVPILVVASMVCCRRRLVPTDMLLAAVHFKDTPEDAGDERLGRIQPAVGVQNVSLQEALVRQDG